MNYKLENAQKYKDELYDKDIVYKELVDNYIRASIEYDKNRLKVKNKQAVDTSEISNSINALSKYTEDLKRKNLLSIVQKINITNEDIRDMIYEGIISAKTLKEILEFKGVLNKENKINIWKEAK